MAVRCIEISRSELLTFPVGLPGRVAPKEHRVPHNSYFAAVKPVGIVVRLDKLSSQVTSLLHIQNLLKTSWKSVIDHFYYIMSQVVAALRNDLLLLFTEQ